MRIAWSMLTVVLCALVPAAPAPAGETSKNLLFFGNSFTYGNGSWTVPNVVKNIATAAGHPAPTVVMQATGGWKLSKHIDKINSDGAANVLHSLPAGQQWDAFVMQDYSTRATLVSSVGGDRTAHIADVQTLAGLVLGQSAGATPVLFETWARQPGHSYYPGTFTDAAAMQQQIRDGYALSADALHAAPGSAAAVIAPVGDAFELANWSDLYNSDKYHANNRGSLLAGLVIYSRIYNEATATIDLSSLSSSMGLASTDGAALAAIADSVVPEPSGVAILVVAVGALGLRRRSRSGL